MVRLTGLFLACLTLAAATAPASAFSPTTRIRIAKRATTLMPAALRRQLERHEALLLQATLAPLRQGEGSGAHALLPGGGTAHQSLDAAVRAAIRAIDAQRPFAEVVQAFGQVAHFSADLCYPPNTSDDDPREGDFYLAFGDFLESRLDRIPLVWTGWADPHLARGDLEAFARKTAERARRDYVTIARSYHPEGRASVPQDFDDRSPAFAAASISFSHAVGATARVWLYIWSEAHGDRRGTPYLRPGAEPFARPLAIESP